MRIAFNRGHRRVYEHIAAHSLRPSPYDWTWSRDPGGLGCPSSPPVPLRFT